jgi:phage-related protein
MARDLNLSVTLSAINRATGPLRQIMQGSQGAGRAIRDTRDQLRSLQDQQKQLTAFRDMSRQSHATRRALMDKREELRQISQQLQSTEGPTRRLTQQQERAQREVDKLTREYRGQRDSVRELARQLPPGIEGTRGLTQQNEALARQIEETNRRLERQQDALRRLGNADVSGHFRNMTGEARRFTRNLTIGATLAAGSIFGLASSTARLGDDVAKTADIMGIGIAELQELRYAAERAGVGTDALDSSMQRFVRRIGRAAQGGGAAAKAYEELGLNATELAAMRPEQALDVIADRLNEVEGQTNKLAYASAIFGNAGESMINMIKGGSGELAELRRQAQETGYVLEEGAARGAEDFQDALLDAQLSMKGMKNTIGAELMPAVTDLMGEFTGWMRSNRSEVQAFARQFGDRLRATVPVLIELAQGVGAFARTLTDLTLRAADLVGGFDKLALILGVLFAGKLIMSVVMFGISLVKAGAALGSLAATLPGLVGGIKALSLAFAATPIGWVIAGITAIAAGAIYLWRNWETIGPKFTALWDTLRELPGRAWAGIKAAFEDGIGGVTRLLLDWSPIGLVTRTWSGLSDSIGNALGAAKGAAAIAWDGIKALLDWSPIGLVTRTWSGLSDSIGNAIEATKGAAAIAWGGIKALLLWSPMETLRGAWAGVSELFAVLWGVVRAAFADGIGSVTRLLLDWSPIGILWRGIRAGLAALGMELPASLSELGGMIIDGLVGGLRAKWDSLRDTIGGIADGVVGWFKDKLGINSPSRVFAGFGGDLLDGLINGIDEKWSVLKDKIGSTAGAVVGWFKDRLGINSPSRVFAELGDDTLAGYRQGLERSEDGALREIKRFGDRVRRAGTGLALGAIATAAVAGGEPGGSGPGGGIAFDTRPPLSASAGGGLQVSIGEINVHAAPGMDEQALARLVAAEVQRALQQAEQRLRARQRSALYDTD